MGSQRDRADSDQCDPDPRMMVDVMRACVFSVHSLKLDLDCIGYCSVAAYRL